jgi:hypothetical protein
MGRLMLSGSALKKEAFTRQIDMHAPEGNVSSSISIYNPHSDM